MDLWAIARYDLGIADAEFWGLTLKKFDALTRRCNEIEKRNDWRAAMICASIYEQNRDKKKRARPFTPADFLEKEPPTVQELIAKAAAITYDLGGEVKN